MEINNRYTKLIKPTGDFVLALLFVVALSPILLLIATVLICHRQPVLFIHLRPGFNNTLFGMYKFTSMIRGDEYTPFWFGKLLRKTSLDELPQLFNVLRGDMSLIGPRPLLEEYLPVYTAEQRMRHNVKPGITGWAQVNGRNVVRLSDKIAYDLYYVNNISASLDFKILLKTLLQVAKLDEADYHDIYPGKVSRPKAEML